MMRRAGLVLVLAACSLWSGATAAAAEGTADSPPVTAAREYEAGVAAYQNRDYPVAEEHLRRALAFLETERGPDDTEVAIALNNLAEVLKTQGRHREAEQLYLRARAIDEHLLGPESLELANDLNNLGMLYKVQGRYPEAEPLYRQSLAIREKLLGPEHPEVAISLCNLATLAENQGRYAEAEPAYRRSLAILEQAHGPDHPDVALALNNLAWLCDAQGRYNEAETLYRRSLTIGETLHGPESREVAVVLNNLAMVYHNQDRPAEAEPLYRRSLAIREQLLGPDHPDVATPLNNLADLYQRQGRYAEAEPLYRRARALMEHALGPDHPAVATVLNNLAFLNTLQGRHREAETLYQQSLSIRKKILGPLHPEVAISLGNLARLKLAMGDTPAALGYFAGAVEALRTTPAAWDGTAYTLRPLPDTVRYLWSYSQAQATDPRQDRRSRLVGALKTARVALDLFARFRSGLSPTTRDRSFHEQSFGALPGWVLHLQAELQQRGVAPDPALALRAVEMGAAWTMLDLLAQARSDAAGALPESVAREEEELLARIQWLNDRAGSRAADAERLGLERTFDKFIARLYRDHPRYAAFRYPRPADLTTVRSALGPDEAAVAYLVSGWGCYAVVITDDSVGFRRLGTEAELQAALDPVLAMLDGAAKLAVGDRERERLGALYRLLVAPVAGATAGKRLILVPSGPLELLSFEMCLAPNGKFLDEAQPVQYIPSLAILALQREWLRNDPATAERLLVVADPDYSTSGPNPALADDREAVRAGFAPLPGTAVEARVIARWFPAGDSLILTGPDANEARVRGEDWRAYGYLHFACHGTLTAGDEPALVLSRAGNAPVADGFLRLSEVMAQPQRSRLTVLSACNSGRAGAQTSRTGISSLARAFLLAGSDGVIASLWSVPDAATAALMSELYRNLRAEKLAPAAALRAAQDSLRRHPRHPEWSHPFFWAPFVFIGP